MRTRSLLLALLGTTLAACVNDVGTTGTTDAPPPAGGPSPTMLAQMPASAADETASPDLAAPTSIDLGVAAPHDGGAADAAVAPKPCTATLCEDFESGAIDPATWTMASDNGGGATIGVDALHVHTGAHALHVHIPHKTTATEANAQIVEKKTFPLLQHGIYGRVFVYAVGTPPGKHAQLVAADESSPASHYYGTHIKFGNLYAVQGGSGIDEGFTSATKLSVGKWTCLEWYYGVGETRTWLDGNDLTDIHETNWAAATFQHLYIGITEEDPTTTDATGFDVWYDDLAVGPARVGCTP